VEIIRAKFETVWRGLQVIFAQGIISMQMNYPKLVTQTTSTGASERFVWPNSIPGMTKWESDAQFARFTAGGMEVINDWYQDGLEVLQEDIDDDRFNVLGPRVTMLAQEGELTKERLVFKLINNGFTNALSLAYDGQFFFDTDHQDGNGPIQSNKGTAALSATSFSAARVQMRSVVDEHRNPVGVKPTILLVPPALEDVANQIVTAEYGVSGASNIYFESVQVIVSSYLTSPTAWFLIDSSRAFKPFVLQQREPLQLVESPEFDEEMFMRRVRRLRASWRGGVGYALWHFAYGSTGTGP